MKVHLVLYFSRIVVDGNTNVVWGGNIQVLSRELLEIAEYLSILC